MSSIIHTDAYIATGIRASIYIYNRAQPLSVLPTSPEFSSVAGHFFHSQRLMIANAGKRACEPFRGNSARKELRSACMTRLFTIHINRVRPSGMEERGGYTHARTVVHYISPVTAYVVTAMCHICRAEVG